MKTSLKVLAAVLAIASAPAMAQFYLGGSVGQADHKMNRSDWAQGGSNSTYKDTATGYKIFGGYQFTPMWGIEGGYIDLRRYEATVTPAVAANAGTATVKVNSWSLFGTGTLPIANGFSAFGKLGISRNTSKMSFTSNGVAFNASDSGSSNKTSFAYGIGASYAINKQVAVRVEYEDFGKAGESNGGFRIAGKTSDSKPTLLSVGLTYSF